MLPTGALDTESGRSERPDRCNRCGGFVVPDWFEEGTGVIDGWRCVICGERLDPIILENKRGQSGQRGRGGNPDRGLALVA